MRATVTYPYRDRETLEVHRTGDEGELTAERVAELSAAGYVDAPEQAGEPAEPAPEKAAQPEAPAAFYVPVEEALDNRAEYRLAEKNVEAQKYRKRMERGKRLPTVGVGAGYLYYNVTDKDVDDGLVFAQVSVPISDWWGGAHALKKARIREQQAENDRLQAREMLAVEIERTWSEVQESYAQILLTRRSVTSAAENLRQNRNFYQAGTAPLTDLLDAETLYTRSRNDFTSACAAYRTSLARYMRVTGR